MIPLVTMTADLLGKAAPGASVLHCLPASRGQASTAELVKTLEHTNGWHRDTAARLVAAA